MWVYGSGFPKSLNIGKAIDKAAGAEREVVGTRTLYRTAATTNPVVGAMEGVSGEGASKDVPVTAPATLEAAQWEGWGTALKPAHEPIVLARKPLVGTVASNVLKHGTGALNIDGTRVGDGGHLKWSEPRKGGYNGYEDKGGSAAKNTKGRWPANVVFDRAAGAALDQQSGVSVSRSGGSSGTTFAAGVPGAPRSDGREGHDDQGGASRFFTQADWGPDDWPFVYQAKPSRKERNAGLEDLPLATAGEVTDRQDGSAGLNSPRAGAGRTSGSRNTHPTVKPVELMRYLVRLVTPPDGLVLDPFAGSGSTGVACVLEGVSFVGIERESEYVEIATRRIEHVT